jgi:hypothetical protein
VNWINRYLAIAEAIQGWGTLSTLYYLYIRYPVGGTQKIYMLDIFHPILPNPGRISFALIQTTSLDQLSGGRSDPNILRQLFV